jgi:4-amino-4-deoxy-L-arabinose transferase-like glycosyltransferase
LPGVALGLYAWCCCVPWLDPRFRPEWDAALYVGLGRSLAAGEGYTYLGEAFFTRPPGLPWLISLFGAGPFEPAPLNRMMMLLATAAVAAVAWALGRSRGAWWGLGAALLAGTSPGWVMQFNTVLAEFPFAVLAYLCVALLAREPSCRVGAAGSGAAAGALLGAALLFRSVGMLLLPGILLVPLLRRSRHALLRAGVACGVALLLAAPWLVWSHGVAAQAPAPSEQRLVFDYTTAILHTDARDPASPRVSPSGWLRRAQDNGEALLRDAGRNVVALPGLGAGAVVAALCALGWATTLRRERGVLAWLAASYSGLLLVYFTYAPRLLLPLLPLLYLYALLGFRTLARRLPRLRPPIPNALVAALALGLLGLNVARLPSTLHPERWGAGEERVATIWADQERVAAWLRAETPRDAVVLARPAPILALLSERRVYSYRFAPLARLLERHRPGYVVVEPAAGRKPLEALLEPLARERWVLPSGRSPLGIVIYRLHGTGSREGGDPGGPSGSASPSPPPPETSSHQRRQAWAS